MLGRRRALRLFAAAALAPAAAAAPRLAAAQTAGGPVVVELFTSQGCHSCPPADALMGELIRDRAEVIGLTFNVDYWDYLGWKDVFGKPEHSKRQRAYAMALKQRHVYTPQMVVQGRSAVIGSRAREVSAAIDAHAAATPSALVSMTRSGGGLDIRVAPGGASGAGTVSLIDFDGPHDQPIERGENGGRTITYFNVVRAIRPLGAWDGRAEARFDAKPLAGMTGCAVLVHGPSKPDGLGPILGAAKIDLPTV